MKTSSKKIILILLIIALAIYVFIRTVQQSTESPASIYISEINSKDTLRLYPDGKFEQVVYNNKNILVYSCVSEWSKTTKGIRIDSILIYDDTKQLNYWKEEPLEGEQYTGWRFEKYKVENL